MALKPLIKSRGVKDVLANTNSPNNGNFLRRSALAWVKDNGEIHLPIHGYFLLNPDSYEESKSANWIEHQVPGQSDPIFQWVSSGARQVSFEALVTADTAYFESYAGTKPGEETDPVKNSINKLGEVASAFFKVTLPPPRQTLEVAADKGDSLDISKYLEYYRSLLLPTYDNYNMPKLVDYSPPLLVLYNGNSFSNIPYGNRVSSKHDLWILKDLKIRITKQLPNLAPMEATVQFTLVQYSVRSKGSDRVHRT